MGLKELLGKWTKRGPDDEPTVHTEDYEGRKADIRAGESFAGAEALETARDDLES
jgi:hypothetical protein